MARKPPEGTIAENVQKWGTGAINVNECRVESKPRLTGTRNPLASAGSGNCYLGSDGKKQIAYDANPPKGRWPANLIHDGSEEVLWLFPPSKSTGGDGEKSRNYKSDERTISGSCQATGGFADSGSAARFFKSFPIEKTDAKRFIYTPKASRKEREAGLEGIEIKKGNPNLISSKTVIRGHPENGKPTPSENKPPLSVHNNHPTVKPLALMRYLCRLVTPPGGTILDPFMGSGSTGMAAKAEGFEFIGIEKNPDYFKIAEKRIAVIST
jgi:site-specific DNA-methyltransferase (adenine-specific)